MNKRFVRREDVSKILDVASNSLVDTLLYKYLGFRVISGILDMWGSFML